MVLSTFEGSVYRRRGQKLLSLILSMKGSATLKPGGGMPGRQGLLFLVIFTLFKFFFISFTYKKQSYQGQVCGICHMRLLQVWNVKDMSFPSVFVLLSSTTSLRVLASGQSLAVNDTNKI